MVSGETAGEPARVYDRGLLLGGAKRDATLQLWEIQRYGTDSFGDADYVSVYGMPPADWYAAGIRLLGRTAVECTRDELAQAIASDIAGILATAPSPSEPLAIDLFAGSGNTLYWILRELPTARGIGFERDAGVFFLTRRNLAVLSVRIDCLNTDYLAGLRSVTTPDDQMLVTFLAPPWGDALDPVAGLDLRRTTPPIAEVMDALVDRFPRNRLLVAVQVHERTNSSSLAKVEARCNWSALRIYDLNRPGENHGILFGSRGWAP